MPDEIETRSPPAVIEMPRPTSTPLILATGLTLLAAGPALNLTLSVVGAAVLAVGLGLWIVDLLPGRGHYHEERAAADRRPQSITPAKDAVEQMAEGKPGYRMRLPLKIHPISAGIRGGLLGGLLMPIPALAWGILSGHGIWYPVNLLSGMVWGGIDRMPTDELEQFRLPLFLSGIVIHGVMSLVLGLLYGVLLPTLPAIRGGQIAWGGLLMPLLWTGISYGLMGVVNPVLQANVSWQWFIASQFVFGITAALVVIRSEKVAVPPRGPGPS
jgi:hypothetical protein